MILLQSQELDKDTPRVDVVNGFGAVSPEPQDIEYCSAPRAVLISSTSKTPLDLSAKPPEKRQEPESRFVRPPGGLFGSDHSPVKATAFGSTFIQKNTGVNLLASIPGKPHTVGWGFGSRPLEVVRESLSAKVQSVKSSLKSVPPKAQAAGLSFGAPLQSTSQATSGFGYGASAMSTLSFGSVSSDLQKTGFTFGAPTDANVNRLESGTQQQQETMLGSTGTGLFGGFSSEGQTNSSVSTKPQKTGFIFGAPTDANVNRLESGTQQQQETMLGSTGTGLFGGFFSLGQTNSSASLGSFASTAAKRSLLIQGQEFCSIGHKPPSYDAPPPSRAALPPPPPPTRAALPPPPPPSGAAPPLPSSYGFPPPPPLPSAAPQAPQLQTFSAPRGGGVRVAKLGGVLRMSNNAVAAAPTEKLKSSQLQTLEKPCLGDIRANYRMMVSFVTLCTVVLCIVWYFT